MPGLPADATICFLGFGEAGGILGADLARQGLSVCAYDILVDAPGSREAMLAKLRDAGVAAAMSLPQAVTGAYLVVSAVTASAAAGVAQAAAARLRPGQFFLDINSVSPEAKRASARRVESSGAAYVEAAVMAPVPPQRLKVPMLLGGTQAASLASGLRALGMQATAVAAEIGIASAIKMCRSVMIKGIEALTVECLRTARYYGAEDAVLKSLAATFPSMGWDRGQADYLISRVAEHGRRRAAELREVAKTVAAAGLEPRMSRATAQAQDALVDDMVAAGIGYDPKRSFSWPAFVDQLGTRPKDADHDDP
jgi:3-hydroxyisobutyrate dehydrogenase-like beta-hydroxyacid dehydrogenase